MASHKAEPNIDAFKQQRQLIPADLFAKTFYSIKELFVAPIINTLPSNN
jgi:hypothetical protein